MAALLRATLFFTSACSFLVAADAGFLVAAPAAAGVPAVAVVVPVGRLLELATLAVVRTFVVVCLSAPTVRLEPLAPLAGGVPEPVAP